MGLATLRDIRQKVLGAPPPMLTSGETLFPSSQLTHWSKMKPTHPAVRTRAGAAQRDLASPTLQILGEKPIAWIAGC